MLDCSFNSLSNLTETTEAPGRFPEELHVIKTKNKMVTLSQQTVSVLLNRNSRTLWFEVDFVSCRHSDCTNLLMLKHFGL